ncbi:hypothetical protein CDD82_547 [Ophiocordyceps australis]|uniref:Palmitoyltransferase n=1 Tax=Ophiocordyceps australis TaxID=1399860 RepID=A0A2C5ZNX2_9HYPO|nr:hypothetical protein CDD82_547 [Ophiocordyceps australis]
MTPLGWVVAFIVALSFFVFVTFFGRLPTFRRTPIAGLYKLLWIHIPNAALALDSIVTAGRLSRSLASFAHFAMHDRHPTVVVLFIAIMAVAEYLFLPDAWPHLGPMTKLSVLVIVALPYVFLALACAADPGYITASNHAYHMSLFPYDHAIFHPGHHCRTCGFIKPPRSKHCSICKRCIAKADHHCIFINSCVGYGNHHWFLLLLVSTALLTSYGSVLGISLLNVVIHARFPDWALLKPRAIYWDRYLAIWGWALQRHVRLGATTLLATLTSPLIWGLLIYTVYLVYSGTTTNESLKWSFFKEDMADGCVFSRPFVSISSTDPSFCRRWPIQPERIIIATDGEPPPHDSQLPGEGEWERVWSLKNVDNIYDLGLRDNLADAFVNNYTFGSPIYDPPAERNRPIRTIGRGH